jgi:hypothetical protein
MTEVKDTIDAEAQRAYLQMLLDAGCKFLLKTWLFGKPYVWVQSAKPESKIFLERIPMEDVADA